MENIEIPESNEYIPPNLNRTVWRVGVYPYLGVKPQCLDKKANCYPGFEMDLLSLIAKLLNVEIRFVYNTNQTGCGNSFNGSSWSGLMGLLQRGEIDLIGNLCSISEYRIYERFSSFSFPIRQDKQNFLIKVPQQKYNFEVTAPFSTNLWYLVLAYIIGYACLFSLGLNIYYNIPIFKGLFLSVSKMLEVIIGTDDEDFDALPTLWYFWLFFVGFFTMLYSNYIKGVLIQPTTIVRPFQTNADLAVKVFKGEYRLIDYRQPLAMPICYQEGCSLFKQGIEKHGYIHLPLGNTEQQTDEFMKAILKEKNLVFVQSKYQTDYYLNDVKEKSLYWSYEDDMVGETWFTYYYRADLETAALLYKTIILLGDFKTNMYTRQLNGMLEGVNHGKFIRDEVPDKTKINLNIILGPFQLYFVGISIAVLGLITEVILFKRRQQELRSTVLYK